MAEAKNLHPEQVLQFKTSAQEVIRLVRETLPDIEKAYTFPTAHGGSHSHDSHKQHKHTHDSHPHTHEHARKGKKAASFKPETLLSAGERWKSLAEAAFWLLPAGLFATADYFFHYLTAAIPGTADDVVLHGGAVIFLTKLAGSLNAFYRGYVPPDSNISLKELGKNIGRAFTERKTNGGVMRGLSHAFSSFMPLEQYEAYQGEGYPTSAVTYAAENLLGSYREGVLGGAVKWIMSLGVIGGSLVTKPAGTAFRYVLSWLHEINEIDENWNWGEKLFFFPVKLAGMVGGTIWFGIAGALDGVVRYSSDLVKGLYYGSQRTIKNRS